MTIADAIKEVGKILIGSGADSIKKKVSVTIEDTKKKIQQTVEYVIKTTVVFLIIVLGFIFALVGLSRYLTETVPSLDHGLGFLVIGGGLVVLGLIVKALTPKRKTYSNHFLTG